MAGILIKTKTYLALVPLLLILQACSSNGPDDTTPVFTTEAPIPRFDLSLHIQAEDATALPQASVQFGQLLRAADDNGRVVLQGLAGPVALVVHAPGHLSEPLILGPDDAASPVLVRLLNDGDGTRWVMHAAGDSMFGRRYQSPNSGEPLIPENDLAAGARHVVADMVNLFASADFRTVNLETAVTDLDERFALPRKRFILNSPTATLAGLAALQVDLAILANNHIRDYGDEGVAVTLAAMDAAGLAYQGAGPSDTAAYESHITSVKGTRIGTLSFTSVTGSFVNNNYPRNGAPVPDDLPEAEAWQYELRTWAYDGPGWQVPAAKRRVGEVWALYADVEADLSTNQRAAAFQAMTAVYPEIQDWVARRGHGGAAMWRDRDASAAIAALRQDVDLVIVQMHAGFQYQRAGAAALRSNARTAIDAGADIVICHHPHILQGVEFYKDRLIAYSLGNFVFEQDFLVTFASAFLRTVWEGNQLIQAKMVPFEIQAYQPVPVSGNAARRTLMDIWEMSLHGDRALRDVDGQVKVIRSQDDGLTQPAQLRWQLGRGHIRLTPPQPMVVGYSIPPGQSQPMEADMLSHNRLGLDDSDSALVDVGRDLFGWGSFEDNTADGQANGTTHWALNSSDKQVLHGEAFAGDRFLRIRSESSDREGILASPIARVPLIRHRLYRQAEDQLAPDDPEPSYSLRFHARLNQPAQARARFELFLFDDSNPTSDPISEELASHDVILDLPADGLWHLFDVAIPAAWLTVDDLRATNVRFGLFLSPAINAEASMDIDNVAFIEWRAAPTMPNRYGANTHIRNRSSETQPLQVLSLPLDR